MRLAALADQRLGRRTGRERERERATLSVAATLG
jgi:hypothetical protein